MSNNVASRQPSPRRGGRKAAPRATLAAHGLSVALSSAALSLTIAGCNVAPADGEEISNDEGAAASAQISGVTFKTQLAGRFLGAVNNGGAGVVATATAAKGAETFTLIDKNGGQLVSGDQVVIQAASGTFLQAANGGGTTLNAASKNQKEWETFRITKASGAGALKSGDVVGLQTITNQTWVSAKGGGGSDVFAYGGSLGDW
jgi:chitinase